MATVAMCLSLQRDLESRLSFVARLLETTYHLYTNRLALWLWHLPRTKQATAKVLEICTIAAQQAAGPEDRQRLQTAVTNIRDQLWDVQQLANRSSAMAWVARSLNDTVLDWDDLVVDLTLSNDSEVKELVRQVADGI